MARKVDVPGVGAKIIDPWVAFLLAFLTFGIYCCRSRSRMPGTT
jgi:hypothetical protein